MHFQSPIQNWPRILAVAPERCFIKAFEGGMLAEAKAEWVRLGRDPAKLHTDFRFFDFIYPFDRAYSFAELKDIWRANFRRFVDRTYLERFAGHVDSVEELNEYYDTRMAHDSALLAPFLASAQAAVAVWNDEFRGRVVTSADGGQGLIPANCRLVIGNSPVGNDIAREFYALAVASDNILGVHPYSKWEHRTRDPQDFRFHSGRWNWDEQAYGIKPVYAFTECGPYLSAAEGWRYADCMGADMGLLLGGMRAWVQDVRTTFAYQEGRILGPGAFFTQGGFGWQMYQYTTDELVELYRMLAVEWRPPALQEIDVDTQIKAEIGQHANDILTLLWLDGKPVQWTIPAPPPPGKLITFYHQNNTPFVPPKVINVAWAMNVTARSGLMLLVSDPAGTDNDLWVRAQDVRP